MKWVHIKSELLELLRPYYWINILLSISYVMCKRVDVLCGLVFSDENCELDSRETEILFFVLIVVMIRTKKAGSVTMVNYFSSSFIYIKLANLILWLYADVRLGLIYGTMFVLCAIFLPTPMYRGPQKITYFRGLNTFDEELSRRKSDVWFICIYAVWHPACSNFFATFAELSAQYGLDNFKFGKLDCGRYPEISQRFRIQDGPTSRQLPTVIMFKEGKEYMRRPMPDNAGKLQKFLFSYDNIRATFELDSIYDACKQRLAQMVADKKTE